MMPTDPGLPRPAQPAQTMRLPVQPPAEPPLEPPADEPPARRRRWLAWAVPLLAFLLGLGVGGAGEQADVTTTPQYMTLQGELDTAQDEIAGAQAQIERIRAEAEAEAEARVQQQMAGVEARSAALDQREQAVIPGENAPRNAEAAGSSLGSGSSLESGSSLGSAGDASAPTDRDCPDFTTQAEAQAALDAVPGDPERLDADNDGIACEDSSSSSRSASSGSVAESAPDAQAPASTYYDNCAAARAAGADPVRLGDAGYGRHLDRDGDGVGCE